MLDSLCGFYFLVSFCLCGCPFLFWKFPIIEKFIEFYLLLFFDFISFALLHSSQLSLCFTLFCQTNNNEIPSHKRNDKVTYENCGLATTRINLACHK